MPKRGLQKRQCAAGKTPALRFRRTFRRRSLVAYVKFLTDCFVRTVEEGRGWVRRGIGLPVAQIAPVQVISPRPEPSGSPRLDKVHARAAATVDFAVTRPLYHTPTLSPTGSTDTRALSPSQTVQRSARRACHPWHLCRAASLRLHPARIRLLPRSLLQRPESRGQGR